MIPKSCKRLAEVDFPIAVVSAHSAREKSIRHGHPSTLHLWWARRPLAACRAMLLALLLPDPCDENCSADFKDKARAPLIGFPGIVLDKDDLSLRRAILHFIGDFANWDNAANPRYLEVGRGLVKAAHGDEPPLVVDPFAGGGSIPLEALRLGCDAFASDLNPVACLILKVMLEDIPRHGPELADELRRVGAEIKKQAQKELAQFYPPDPDGATPIAYLWARTVRCESPNCGAEIPLMRSFWLRKKASRLRALRVKVLRNPSRDREGADAALRESSRDREGADAAMPLAYFITFTCYGTWLHGRDSGSVDKEHNLPGTPFVSRDPDRLSAEEKSLEQSPYEMEHRRRAVVLEAIREVCAHRGWSLLAAHVRTNHVHVVTHAADSPERVMNDFKAYASRKLNQAGLDDSERRRWSRHGSTRYLWKPQEVEAAIQYAVEKQGEPMAVFENKDRLLTRAAPIPCVEFEVFEPKSGKEVPPGTVNRGNATCLVCQRVLPVERVRVQLREQRGGAGTIFDARGNRIGGARLLAVVTLKDDKAGRQYRVATERDYEAAWKAQKAAAKLANEKLPNGLSVIPDEPTPAGGGSGAGRAFSVQNYGMMQFGDLFTARQKLALSTVAEGARNAQPSGRSSLSDVLSRCADYWSCGVVWAQEGEFVAHTFGRQALPIVWDFAEAVPWAEASGNLQGAIDWVSAVIEGLPRSRVAGQTQPADACQFPLPDDSCAVYFTDPPYYDAVPYADLSDFFYVWLKRAMPDDPLMREALTPKEREIVQDETKRAPSPQPSPTGRGSKDEGLRPKDRAFFEERMARAFAEGRRVLKDDGVASVVFAHKTTEGWEALLSGMIRGGWTITGSWPVSTERPGRLRAQESAALATSVHLICRPRPENAPVGDWAEMFRELPNRIGDWMERLSAEGIRGADLVFACIGPAMEIYSRYSRVEDAEGREVPLGGDPEASEPHKRGFLAYVWEIVGRTALGQVLGGGSGFQPDKTGKMPVPQGSFEEDARLTALFLWTIQATTGNSEAENPHPDPLPEGEGEEGDDDDEDSATVRPAKGLTLIYDVVRRFSQPLGIHLDTWNGRIIETKKGIVRLLPVKERAEHLLGEDGASGVADVIERSRGGPIQFSLLADDKAPEVPRRRSGGKRSEKSTADEAPSVAPGTTTLDRVHIAMLLQASGQANALRTMLKAEQERGSDFLRLANALSALYPRDSEEKRLLDAMLLAVPR